MSEYKIKITTSGDGLKNTSAQVLAEITNKTIDVVNEALQGKEDMMQIHPRTLIAMITANVAVNLAGIAVGDTKVLATRLKMIRDLANEVHHLITESWKMIETANAKGEAH